jgi:hypothetical protein
MANRWGVTGCLVINMPRNESGDSEMYSAGARWAPRASGRIAPYAQVLVGVRRITREIDDPEKRQELRNAWDDGNGTLPHYPMRSEWSTEHQANGFAMAMGGGVDFVVNGALAWRVGNLEYTHTWIPGVDQIHASDRVRFTSGLTLRIWHVVISLSPCSKLIASDWNFAPAGFGQRTRSGQSILIPNLFPAHITFPQISKVAPPLVY